MAFNFTSVSSDDLATILAEEFHADLVQAARDSQRAATPILASIMVGGEPTEIDLHTLSNFKLDALQLDALAHGDTDLSEAIDSILADREI